MSEPISKCRVCGNTNLITVLELGDQVLTGIFPKDPHKPISSGPLSLLKCHGENSCGLLQLANSYPLGEMYGENYGYRSGLNPSMVSHLKQKVERIKALNVIESGDVIVDIGSNDATTLRHYHLEDCSLVGIDPTAAKFSEYYDDKIELVADFFTSKAFKEVFPDRKAKVVTSFSMFYDLEDPMKFMTEVRDILDDNGVWVFEQSYMPLMLQTNSYDTVCHEHLEYYALKQIVWMADKVGLRVVDVETNSVNGGSFSVTVQKESGSLAVSTSVREMTDHEEGLRLDDLQTYVEFKNRTVESREALLQFLNDAKAEGKKVLALGASTKGNVVLQYCGIDSNLISMIGEVNPDKFGSFTPGSLIPIVNEQLVMDENPDFVLVLPWHFAEYFNSTDRYADLNLVYPLPELVGN